MLPFIFVLSILRCSDTWLFVVVYLEPSQRGRRIMSTMIRSLTHEFMSSQLECAYITRPYFENNPGRRKVTERNEFVSDGIVSDCLELLEIKAGVKGGVEFMR
jgi:hypothetical protein